VRDGAVSQQALDVGLADSRQVADGHGQDGYNSQQRLPGIACGRERPEEDAQKERERSGF